jgi:hypothetical protein
VSCGRFSTPRLPHVLNRPNRDWQSNKQPTNGLAQAKPTKIHNMTYRATSGTKLQGYLKLCFKFQRPFIWFPTINTPFVFGARFSLGLDSTMSLRSYGKTFTMLNTISTPAFLTRLLPPSPPFLWFRTKGMPESSHMFRSYPLALF